MTKTQLEGLRRIRDGGRMEWCRGKRRGGGSVGRMFDRLAAEGYCTLAPHEITDKGREALAQANL